MGKLVTVEGDPGNLLKNLSCGFKGYWQPSEKNYPVELLLEGVG